MRYKHVEMTLLFDFYGDVLTEKQHALFDLYYNEDLSLSEIAELEGITRQGVRDSIIRSEDILRDTEKKLGLVAKFHRMHDNLREIADDAQQIIELNRSRFGDERLSLLAEKILSSAVALRE